MDKTLSNDELERARKLARHVTEELIRQNPYATPPGYMLGDDYD